MSIYHAASKAGLLLLNLVVVAIGVALVGVGWLILHGAPYAQKFAEALKQEYIPKDYRQLLANLVKIDVETGIWKQVPLIEPFGVSFAAVGASLVTVGAVGVCAALCCCHTRLTRVVLLVYAVLSAAGLCLWAARVLLRNVLNEQLMHYIAEGLAHTIRTQFMDLFQILDDMTENGGQLNLIATAWNIAMISLQCCGSLNFTDFEGAQKWNRNYTFENFYSPSPMIVPTTCCRLSFSSLQDMAIDVIKYSFFHMGYYQTQNYMEDRHCPVAPTEANSYVNTTCVHAVYSLIAPWITMSRVAEAFMTVVLCLPVGLAFLILRIVCLLEKKDEHNTYFASRTEADNTSRFYGEPSRGGNWSGEEAEYEMQGTFQAAHQQHSNLAYEYESDNVRESAASAAGLQYNGEAAAQHTGAGVYPYDSPPPYGESVQPPPCIPHIRVEQPSPTYSYNAGDKVFTIGNGEQTTHF